MSALKDLEGAEVGNVGSGRAAHGLLTSLLIFGPW